MKILMLVPFLPNTQMSGGQTRWYNLIKHLSKEHEITLLSLIKDDWEKKFVPELEKYCKKVLVFKRPKSPWTFRNLFLTAVSSYPLVVIRNFSLEERRAIKKELENNKYDLIHAETFYVMPHIPKTKTPVILVEPTIEFSVYKHYVDHEVSWFLKTLYMFDIFKLKFWEKYFWKKADKLMAVSREDKVIMNRELPNKKVGVIPNGIDYEFLNEKKKKNNGAPRVLYVGNYAWMQNVEAVDILIKDIWPDIKSRVKNAKLWIVGVNMTDEIIKLAKERDDVLVTQAIPDIRDAYKNSSVLVAPIKGPGGTRLKVLEALASGLPVVSTSVGVAGLGLVSGKHALVSNNISDLSNLAVKIINNKSYAQKISESAQSFVSKKFDWKSIVGKLDTSYRDVLS